MGAGGGRGYGGTEPAMDYHHTQGGGGGSRNASLSQCYRNWI